MDRNLGFWRDERGQDLAEYSLLLTFVALACISFLGIFQPNTTAIWHTANTDLTSANTAANGH